MEDPRPIMNESDLDRVLAEHHQTVHGATFKSPPQTPPAQDHDSTIDLQTLAISDTTRKRILEGHQHDKNSRSEEDQAVVDALVYARCTDSQIYNIFDTFPIGEKYKEKRKNGEKYLAKSIKKAREFVKGKPEPKPAQEQISKPIIPASELLTKEYLEPPAVIGGGILPEGGGLILDGESGDGKSLLRTELAIHIAMGQDCWGLRIPTARTVLIVQFENTFSQERYRLKKMLEGLCIDEREVHHRLFFSNPSLRIDLKLKGDHRKALDLVQQSGAEVVIWDPLSSLHTANENDNILMRAVLDTLTCIARQTNTTNTVIDHFGKPSFETPLAHRGRGASTKRDWCDTKISVTPKRHEHKILRVLTFVKIRNGPSRPDILLERDGFFLHHVVDEDSLCPPSKVQEVLSSLGGQVEKQSELIKAICEEVHCGERSARKFIKAAVDAKFIQEVDNGIGKSKAFSI